MTSQKQLQWMRKKKRPDESLSRKDRKGKNADTRDRRLFIRRRYLQVGKISFADIKKRFPRTHYSSIHEDVGLLKSIGEPIEVEEIEGAQWIVYRDSIHPLTVESRKSQSNKEKAAIARIGSGLILGLTQQPPDSSLISNCSYQNELLMALETLGTRVLFGQNNAAQRVINFLKLYWKKQHRAIAMDAGTTNHAISEILFRLRSGDPIGSLGGLSVFTNSPGIVDQFREFVRSTEGSLHRLPSCAIEVIPIGGRLRSDTDAITGELTRRCLESWQINLDIAVIGTTNFDFQDMRLGCDSEDEALTKSILLARSSLRCIVADSTKFQISPQTVRSAFPFAGVTENNIDLVLTDEKVEDEIVRECGKRGVAVLKSPYFKTTNP